MDCTDAFCLLCCKTIADKDFKVIGETIRSTLNALLPQLNSSSRNKQAICKDCSRRLSVTFEFKSKCLDAANVITRIDCEGALQKENISDDQEICRLCGQPAKGEHISLRGVTIGTFRVLLPEINFGAVRDPVVCNSCFDSADTHTSFLRDYLDVERKVKESSENPKRSSRPDDTSPDLPIKIEDVRIKTEDNECEILDRPEYVEIKSEGNGRESDAYPFYPNKQTIDNISQRGSEEGGSSTHVKHEVEQDRPQPEEEPLDAEPHPEDPPETPPYDVPRPKAPSETHLGRVKTDRRVPSAKHKPLHKCAVCPYETAWKRHLSRRSLKHRDPALVELHWQESLATHRARHGVAGEGKVGRCSERAVAGTKRGSLWGRRFGSGEFPFWFGRE